MSLLLQDTLSSGVAAFHNEVIGMGNRNIELWVLVFSDTTGVLGDSGDSFGYCNEVVQEKEERGCTA